jgi:hypothetical protein
MRIRIALSVAAALLAAVPCRAQEHSGLVLRVVSHGTGEPIAGVQVSVVGLPHTALSDATGIVRLAEIRPGSRAVRLERIGYATEQVVVDFAAGESAEGEVELNPQPVALAGVEARARGSAALRANGFYDRKRSGAGTFVDRDEVDARARVSVRVSTLLERLPGIKVIPKGTSGAMITSHRASGAGCSYAQVFLNGQRISGDPVIQPGRGGRTSGRPRFAGVDVDALITLPGVEGVEWYPGVAGLPPEFNITGGEDGGPGCGTLVIWTRQGR